MSIPTTKHWNSCELISANGNILDCQYKTGGGIVACDVRTWPTTRPQTIGRIPRRTHTLSPSTRVHHRFSPSRDMIISRPSRWMRAPPEHAQAPKRRNVACSGWSIYPTSRDFVCCAAPSSSSTPRQARPCQWVCGVSFPGSARRGRSSYGPS